MRGNLLHAPKITICPSFNLTRLQGKSVNGVLIYHRESSAHAPYIANTKYHSGHITEFKPAHMTIPYIHPHLKTPVPPLHLPWHFGALCWSFPLAGVMMLNLPQNWTLRRGCLVVGTRVDEHQRHWFPYRAFAWVLILSQVSDLLSILILCADSLCI